MNELLLDEGMNYMSFGAPLGPSKMYVQHAAICSGPNPSNRTDTVSRSLFNVVDGPMQNPLSDRNNRERRYSAGHFVS